MIKTVCATLVLLCSAFNYQWDFNYKNKDEFVLGITECTIVFCQFLSFHKNYYPLKQILINPN